MKKASLVIIILTMICCAFSVGFFLGRGTGHSSITVSAVPTAAPSQTPPATQPSSPLLIDINTATAEEFSALPGIGDTLAKRIVTYRDQHGPFENLAGLLNVEGIGEKKLESILDYIIIGGQP